MTQQPRIRGWVLIGLLAGPFLTMVDSSIVNVGLPAISSSLNCSLEDVQWVASLYLLSLGLTLAFVADGAKRWGSLRLYTVSLIGFTLLSGLSALAPSLPWLVTARVVQGLFGGPLVPLAMNMMFGGDGHAQKQMPAMAGMVLFLAPAIAPRLGRRADSLGRLAPHFSSQRAGRGSRIGRGTAHPARVGRTAPCDCATVRWCGIRWAGGGLDSRDVWCRGRPAARLVGGFRVAHLNRRIVALNRIRRVGQTSSPSHRGCVLHGKRASCPRPAVIRTGVGSHLWGDLSGAGVYANHSGADTAGSGIDIIAARARHRRRLCHRESIAP